MATSLSRESGSGNSAEANVSPTMEFVAAGAETAAAHDGIDTQKPGVHSPWHPSSLCGVDGTAVTLTREPAAPEDDVTTIDEIPS